MGQVRTFSDEAARSAAADWIVRLHADDLTPEDAAAFDGWLSASPDNVAAYDAALAVWAAYGAASNEVEQALRTQRRGRPALTRRFYLAAGSMAAAAAVAVVLAPELGAGTKTDLYSAGRGERETVALADGSRIELNAGTRLSVTLDRDARRVVLDHGQAVFDVTHDPRRPFLIAAGDRTVRVVGTQFDVRRRNGRLSVTVARGVVEVHPAGGDGRAYRLRAGQRLDHVEGAPQTSVSAAAPEEVLGWRSGRLVYRDRPLSEVVSDLNDQFDAPIRIADPQLAAAPISGVLVLDDQDAVIRRLALLAPIVAERSDSGVILRYKDARR